MRMLLAESHLDSNFHTSGYIVWNEGTRCPSFTILYQDHLEQVVQRLLEQGGVLLGETWYAHTFHWLLQLEALKKAELIKMQNHQIEVREYCRGRKNCQRYPCSWRWRNLPETRSRHCRSLLHLSPLSLGHVEQKATINARGFDAVVILTSRGDECGKYWGVQLCGVYHLHCQQIRCRHNISR